jgi:hypothetical protein
LIVFSMIEIYRLLIVDCWLLSLSLFLVAIFSSHPHCDCSLSFILFLNVIDWFVKEKIVWVVTDRRDDECEWSASIWSSQSCKREWNTSHPIQSNLIHSNIEWISTQSQFQSHNENQQWWRESMCVCVCVCVCEWNIHICRLFQKIKSKEKFSIWVRRSQNWIVRFWVWGKRSQKENKQKATILKESEREREKKNKNENYV